MADINYLGVSGGKDSTAALLWLVHDSGYPPASLRVTFCNTHNEHQFTYDYINMLSEKVHPIEWLEPQLGFYELVAKKGRFPSTKARFCTEQLKLWPTQADVLRLLREDKTVLLHTGVRHSESEERSKLPERGFDEFYGCEVYRPLIDWPIEDVWAYLHKHNIPRNPLYDYGARRVGCFPCIMSVKQEMKMIAKYFPERIDRIREAEKEIGSTFFHRSKVPEIQRSLLITTKENEQMYVPTIDDVARWSQTGRGGKQYEFDIDEAPTCSNLTGACE